jgi:nucleotide-binding universal stress UspA family protein
MRIVGAIDLGEGSEHVAAFTGSLAERLDGTADLVHVCGHEEGTAALAAKKASLEALMAPWPEARRGQARCEQGTAVDILLAKTREYDAVVVRPRSGRFWEHLFLGSVAAHVVRKAECPVFVCRGNPLPEVPRLLVGLDVRRGTHERLMEHASAWVPRLGGKLDAVYIDTNRLPFIRDATVRHAATSELEAVRERDRRILERTVGVLPMEFRGEVAVVEGAGPGEKLVEVSEDYDLLLVGSLERQGVVQHLIGSVAEYVVSRAKSNVLTFPSQLG